MNLKQIFRYRWQECSFVSAMKAWLVSYLFDDWMLTPVDTFSLSSLLPILLTEAFREVSAYPWLQIHPIERKSKAQILFQDHEFCWQLWQQDEEVLQRKHSTHFDVGQQVCETAEKYNLRSKGPFMSSIELWKWNRPDSHDMTDTHISFDKMHESVEWFAFFQLMQTNKSSSFINQIHFIERYFGF